jgi:hypothetical protein
MNHRGYHGFQADFRIFVLLFYVGQHVQSLVTGTAGDGEQNVFFVGKVIVDNGAALADLADEMPYRGIRKTFLEKQLDRL